MREKAKTLLDKSEDGGGPGHLECDVFKVFCDAAMNVEVCVQEAWKCAFLSVNNRLFFKEITIF